MVTLTSNRSMPEAGETSLLALGNFPDTNLVWAVPFMNFNSTSTESYRGSTGMVIMITCYQ